MNSLALEGDKEEVMDNENMKFKIVDDPSVRESYANKLISASFDGGGCHSDTWCCAFCARR